MPYLISELLSALPNPVTADPGEPILDALTRMLQRGYSQLPVVKKTSGQPTQYYLITSNKILETLKFLQLPLSGKGLTVEHALVKVPHVFTEDDTIKDVMVGLKDMDAALIVNNQGELIRVVTIYDTTHFFRRWSEDLLSARDVELSLRKIIEGAFKWSDGTIDEQARQKAIDGAGTDDEDLSGKDGYKRFTAALKGYLGLQQAGGRITLDRRKAYAACKVLLDSYKPSAPPSLVAERVIVPSEKPQPVVSSPSVAGSTSSAIPTPATEKVVPDSAAPSSAVSVSSAGAIAPTAMASLVAAKEFHQWFDAALQHYLDLTQASPELNETWLNAAYRQHLLQAKQETRVFNKLTLGVYISLFFHDRCWGRCESAFGFDRTVVERILKTVQNVRNLLTHFREEEITEEHRRELRQAAEWMSEYQKKALTKLDETAPTPPAEPDGLASILEMPAEARPGSSA